MNRYAVPLLGAFALLLAACASDSTFTIAGRAPHPQALEEDASDCRSIGPAIEGFFGGALIGAATGVQAGVASGAEPTGAAVGATLGSLVGLIVGATMSVSGDAYDRCMIDKGYRLAATPAVALQQVSDEPAR